jgi:hypothetical protein
MTDTPVEPQPPEVVLGDAPEIVGSPWLLEDPDQGPVDDPAEEDPQDPSDVPENVGTALEETP